MIFFLRSHEISRSYGIKDDATNIHTTTMYLKDTAALWWRRRHGDIKKGTCAMQTFNEFISDFKRQFYPENAIHEAKIRLRRLKQTELIRGYVKKFTSLTLEIPDLSDDDAFFYFLDGISPRARMEIRGRGVRDLAGAIAEAESIAELHKEAKHKEKHEGRSGKREEATKLRSPLRRSGKRNRLKHHRSCR